MKIVMGEGVIQRTARCSLTLVLATIHDGMTWTSRSCWRWGVLIVLAVCLVSPVAAGQEPEQQVKAPPHIGPNVVDVPVAKTMPNLMGRTYEQAQIILTAEHLPKPVPTYGSSDRPPGYVYSQDPPPGAMLAKGQQISLSVSSSKPGGQDSQQQAEQPTYVTPPAKTRIMPSLIGLPYTNALGILGKMQLPHPSLEYGSSGVPAGDVYAQNPAPGAALSPEQPIVLHVSSVTPPLIMPNLIGLPYKNAFGILSKMQLPHPNLQYVASNQPAGVVMGQSPIGGTSMRGITVVSLQVSRVSDITVPDVVGSSESAATASITQSQLHAVHQGDESSRRQRGQVTRTEPVSGTLVQLDSTVGYWLASGNNVVPDLLRRTVDDSQVILKEAGFRPGETSYKTTTGPAGLVIDQDPKPRSIAAMNSSVAITVNVQQIPVPSVEGMTPDQAASTLNKAGFATVSVVHKFHFAMPNRVFRQDPQPSAAIDPITKVSLEVPSLMGLAIFAAGLLAGAGGIGAGLLRAYQRHLIEITKRLLHIKPSLGPASETRIARDLPLQMDEPVVTLRPRLETGEVIFDGPISIVRQETSHD